MDGGGTVINNGDPNVKVQDRLLGSMKNGAGGAKKQKKSIKKKRKKRKEKTRDTDRKVKSGSRRPCQEG